MHEVFNVLIEVPKGTVNNKYERDPKTGKIVLDFVFENLVWPFNYGEISGTKGGDDDCLDAMVFSDQPLLLGETVKCKPFGVILMLDRGVADDKILMVPENNPIALKYRDITDFSGQERKEMENLYAEIARQKKKVIETKGYEGKNYSINLIKNSAG